MKIVCCKKCSAKYQLEDDDDISAFECTSCTGELELCNNETQNKAESYTPNNTNIVYCVECGSRYALSDKDNILEYECENCGGPLRYVNEEMNQNIGKIINNQKQNGNFSSNIKETPSNSIKSISNRFGGLFSENSHHNISNNNDINRESPRPTAKTRIPTDTQRKFGKEFLVPATNDYYILKEYLKKQFFDGVSQYYGMDMNKDIPNGTYRNITKEPDYIDQEDFENEVKAENESLKNSKNISIIIGSLIFIGSVGEILLFNNGIGIITIFIGVILISYGLYRAKDKGEEVQKRHKIIRDHLLSLPEDYYVFYDVRIPGSDRGINHLVIGPSGIYEILSQKFNPKNKSEESSIVENENISGEINNLDNIGSFRYTTKLSKFQQDNKIKQEALKLGENLMNFLSSNGIRNCFVEPLVGFVNADVVVINMPLTDEDLFIDELIHQIEYGSVKLDSETIDKCAILVSRYAVDCSLYEH